MKRAISILCLSLTSPAFSGVAPEFSFDDPTLGLELPSAAVMPAAKPAAVATPAANWIGDRPASGLPTSVSDGHTKWDSFALQPTHKRIAVGALTKVSKTQYPDLIANQAEIILGSNDETAHCDPKNLSNGGDTRDLWLGISKCSDGGVVPNFKAGKYAKAYHNLGRMIHLIQDQAVPAHAANIPHFVPGARAQDGFELITDYVGNIKFTPAPDMEPYLYYQAIQDDTRRHLAEWKHPFRNCQMWLPSPAAPPLGQDAAAGPLGAGIDGKYGCGRDSYVELMPDENGSGMHQAAVAPEIGERQLSQAAAYSAGVMMAASKRLQAIKAGQ